MKWSIGRRPLYRPAIGSRNLKCPCFQSYHTTTTHCTIPLHGPRTYPQQFSSSSPSSPMIHFQSPLNAGKAGRRANKIGEHKIDTLIPRFILLLALAAAVGEEDNILLCYHWVWKGVRTSGRMIHRAQWEKGSATHVPFNSSSTHHFSSTSQHGATSKS